MGQILIIMSKIAENIVIKNDDGHDWYGTAIVSIRDTDTSEVRTATARYDSSKSKEEAISEAIEIASNKF